MSTSMTRAAPGARRRRRWTAAEKTACLRAFAASGQSAAAFCRERGVPRATLMLWRRTADAPPACERPSDSEAAPLARFARVEVVAPPEITAPAATPALAGLTLTLRMPDGREAVVTGLDATAAVAMLRGVCVPGAGRRPGAA